MDGDISEDSEDEGGESDTGQAAGDKDPLDADAPQVVIPVYTKPDEPTKVLGKPISLREASELLETSVMSDLNTSQSSLSSCITSLSPLVQSTRARMVSMSPMSPLVTSSSISAVLGPIPSSQAKNLYRRWRTGGGSEGDGDMAATRQRNCK